MVWVSYPSTFKHSPNLTIKFQKMRRPLGSWDIGGLSEPKYKITEQRPDGFKATPPAHTAKHPPNPTVYASDDKKYHRQTHL